MEYVRRIFHEVLHNFDLTLYDEHNSCVRENKFYN